jgi:hypothetical protein
MNNEVDRNLGEQPITQIMTEHNLQAHDLVANSTEQITHKMVVRACKGRRLTSNVKAKIRNALNNSVDKEYSIKDLFTY